MKWPERLRRVRQHRNMKQRELAELVLVSAQTIYDIESGRRRAHAELIAQLAQVLHVSADYLLGLSDDPNPHGLQDEPAGLKKIFWALKDDALLAALTARCLNLPTKARLSVLEHWEMDLLIEEKKPPERPATSIVNISFQQPSMKKQFLLTQKERLSRSGKIRLLTGGIPMKNRADKGQP